MENQHALSLLCCGGNCRAGIDREGRAEGTAEGARSSSGFFFAEGADISGVFRIEEDPVACGSRHLSSL
jgi:hypothetical protein